MQTIYLWLFYLQKPVWICHKCHKTIQRSKTSSNSSRSESQSSRSSEQPRKDHQSTPSSKSDSSQPPASVVGSSRGSPKQNDRHMGANNEDSRIVVPPGKSKTLSQNNHSGDMQDIQMCSDNTIVSKFKLNSDQRIGFLFCMQKFLLLFLIMNKI